jgi:hypothetical protein
MNTVSIRQQGASWVINFSGSSLTLDEAAAIQVRNTLVKELGAPSAQELAAVAKVA